METVGTINRCTKCIMPANYPGIHFDECGVCNFCESHKPMTKNLVTTGLIELLESKRNRGAFDCLVPISGGKDSIFILYYAVKVLRLNVLAVNYDSGFQSDIARENIKNACEILKVPLVIRKVNARRQSQMLKAILKISSLLGSYFHICGNCEVALRSSAINTARENHIEIVLWGGSPQEGSQPDSYYKYMGKRGFLRQMNTLTFIRIIPDAIKYVFLSIAQRLELGVPVRYALNPIGALPFPKKNPMFVSFYDYVDNDIEDKIRKISKELNWRYPQDRTARFDCLLHCFGNHHSLQTTNISSDGLVYCSYVRDGLMTREKALREEDLIKKTASEECEKLIGGLSL